MNQYHIYQAIGHGKCSAVYKARMKKKIPYLAIKSVDRSQKSKVLQEVKILHTLDHPNVLKFYSWYETSAHLWLVLEYCVGGDLLALLRQDHQLPEDSIHDLACGIVRALQFLHSQGIIYCDLKPSNILLDENGQTKLCDFGLARKLNDISKTPCSSLPQAKRGSPCYMAPELFQEGGVHSYASDFWALGCILYECYAGRPPFSGKELTKLIKSIVLDPVPILPGSPSRPFVNLINSLLVKNPAERIQWPELCVHAFWREKFTLRPLPPEPAFSSMVDHFQRILAVHSGDAHQINTPSRHRRKDSKGHLWQEESSAKGFNTPVKASQSSQRVQAKVSSKIATDKPRDGSDFSKGVNVLRLSKIAKANLQKENEKENYRRQLPNSAENDAEVNVENTDMELDFNENAEEDVQDEAVEPNHPTCSPIKTSELDNADQLNGSKETEQTMPDETHEVSVASPSPCASPQIKARGDKDPMTVMHESDSSVSPSNLSQLLWHPSDFSVRPVMPSRKAEKVLETAPSLPFDTLPAPEFTKLSKEQLDAVTSRIITILNGNASTSDKQNVIKYLEMVSSNTEVANLLTNGPVMLVLVKMLIQSKVLALRIQVVSLIALLIRHSTFITEDLSNSGILRSLTDGLRDKQERMRRFSMAALGELLFYIATQDEQSQTSNHMESPKNKPSSSAWQVSSSLISLVSSVLRKGEDDLTQLYALKTIENICSQGASWAARFTTQDVIANLCYIFRAAGKQEIIRMTAGSSLARIVCFSPSSIQSVIENISLKDIASRLIKGNTREQQICLNLLNTTLIRSHMFTNIVHLIAPLVDDKNLVMNFMLLIERGNEILRGKSLIFVGLLCKNGRRGLSHFFCSQKLLSTLDKLLKDKDQYVQQCLEAFVDIMASLVPGLLETITGDIQQRMVDKNQRHKSLFGRTPTRTHLHLLPVVLQLLGSFTLRRKAVNSQVLQQLANLFKLIESTFQGRDDIQTTLVRILEVIVGEPCVVVEHADILCLHISQRLTIVYKGNKDGNARFLCLKILFDIMVILLNEPSEELHNFISTSKDYFFTLYPIMIEDEDPIPIYAQKLLSVLMDFNYIKITDILDRQTVSRCFDFVLGDFASANDNNVNLCVALASASELETNVLSQLKVVRQIGSFLEFVKAKEMEDFVEPVLSLCRIFLLRSLGRTKDLDRTDESDLVFDVSSARKEQQSFIKDIPSLGYNVGVLVELSGSQRSNVADIASECVVLLLKSAPREAATGLLSNLPKVTAVLMSLSCPAVLCRMLRSLGYACRQYVSQGMILSIPAPEVAKIEAIVLQLKISNLDGVPEACLLLDSSLQQLAHFI